MVPTVKHPKHSKHPKQSDSTPYSTKHPKHFVSSNCTVGPNPQRVQGCRCTYGTAALKSSGTKGTKVTAGIGMGTPLKRGPHPSHRNGGTHPTANTSHPLSHSTARAEPPRRNHE